MNSFCLYFDSRRIHELDFLLQRLACSSLTPRWFIEALRCINDLVHSEKKGPISAFACCTVLIMISSRVIGLRSLESDIFLQFLTGGKIQKFSPSATFAIWIKKNEKYRVLHGHYWTQKNTDWSWRQDASLGDFPFAKRETWFFFFFLWILGPMM